jgi:hypothetical protein
MESPRILDRFTLARTDVPACHFERGWEEVDETASRWGALSRCARVISNRS